MFAVRGNSEKARNSPARCQINFVEEFYAFPATMNYLKIFLKDFFLVIRGEEIKVVRKRLA